MFKQDIWIEKTQTHTTYGLDQFQELCKVIHFVLKKRDPLTLHLDVG